MATDTTTQISKPAPFIEGMGKTFAEGLAQPTSLGGVGIGTAIDTTKFQPTIAYQGALGREGQKAAAAQAKAEVDKGKAAIDNEIKLESIKIDGKSQILQEEAAIKERLMALEFQHNMQLKQLEAQTKSATQLLAENRKDQRSKMEATQQSELINQKNNQLPPKNFEEEIVEDIGGFEDL